MIAGRSRQCDIRMVWQHLDGAFEPLPAGRFAVADEVLQAELKRADAQAAGQILQLGRDRP